jgi:beta-glucosidase
MKISPQQVALKGSKDLAVNVDVEISNTGKRTGAEVVQLYLGMPSTSAVPQPPKQLKGFQRVSLNAGKHAHVRLVLDARALSYWDMNTHAWAVAPGTYHVMVGASSRDIRAQGQFEVSGR